MPDAAVVGAGPNGLVADDLLADEGWSVEVLEARDEPGGGVRHDHGVDPDFTNDLFSSFHPPAAASPVLAGLRLTGTWDAKEQELMADRVERQVERFAPGFRALIRARRILAPPTLQALNANLHGGAINGRTAALHQQLVFRPVPGAGRPETPVRNLYPASASAHPGGVHGALVSDAARAALRRNLPTGLSGGPAPAGPPRPSGRATPVRAAPGPAPGPVPATPASAVAECTDTAPWRGTFLGGCLCSAARRAGWRRRRPAPEPRHPRHVTRATSPSRGRR